MSLSTNPAKGIEKMTIELNQGITEKGRKFGYVHGKNGGFFFTWMETLAATLASVEADEVDGDGGLEIDEVRSFLGSKIAQKFTA
jgi:hypothetical protein